MTLGTDSPHTVATMMTTEQFKAITGHLGVDADTAKKWRQRGRVPHARKFDFLDAAERLGFDISRLDMERLDRLANTRRAA